MRVLTSSDFWTLLMKLTGWTKSSKLSVKAKPGVHQLNGLLI